MKILKLITALAALAALAALVAPPAASQGRVPCWEQVINDWWDNSVVDNVYPIRCYREALAQLPEDMEAYSSAPEDIRRAMRDAVRSQQGLTSPGGGPDSGVEDRGDVEMTDASSRGDPGRGGPRGSDPGDGFNDAGRFDDEGGGFGGGSGGFGGGSDGGGTGPPGAPGSTDDLRGDERGDERGDQRDARGGFFREALDTIAPGEPSSFPLPLLILAAIALLLLALGTGGVLARRLQASRIRLPGR